MLGICVNSKKRALQEIRLLTDIETTSKPTRVLHVLGSLAYGGIETWIMDMKRRLDPKEYQLDVCLLGDKSGEYEDEFRRLGGEIHRCPLGKNLLSFSKALQRILREGRYDIFHSHCYYASGFFLRLARKVRGVKTVAHLHPTADIQPARVSFARPVYRALMRWWIKRYADAILGCTTATLESVWGPRWQEDVRMHVLPNGIDLSVFDCDVNPAQVRAELNLPENARIVLTVGRFVSHKNHIIIPEIAQHICSSFPDVYFVLPGDGPKRKLTEEIVRSRGLMDRFRFPGIVPNLVSLWKSSDVFLFPSQMEGFGIVVIEAAAAGLPVVACRIPGVTEAAKACHNVSLLRKDETSEAFAEAVVNALQSDRLSGKDYERFKAKFSFTTDNSLHILQKVYSGLMKRS